MGWRRRALRAAWLVLLEKESLRIVPPEQSDAFEESVRFPPEQLMEQAPAVVDALSAAGWRRAPLVLALGADLVLSSTVDVPAANMLRKPQAMRYHLEGWIPWSAEEFVVDYVGHKNEAFMAAVRGQPLAGLIEALEEREAAPIFIAPAALLALQAHLGLNAAPGEHGLLWKHGDELELLTVRDNRPLAWQHLPSCNGHESVQLLGVAALEASRELPWYSLELPAADVQKLEATDAAIIPLDGPSWDDALRQTAARIAAGYEEPLINLRRNELAGKRAIDALAREVRRLKAAAALLVVAACVALWLAGERYRHGITAVNEHLVQVYERTFPDKPVPERIAQAFRKEHALLAATRGPAKDLPTADSADQMAERVLAALPSDLRYRVPEIRAEGPSVFISGEVRSNADADAIAAHLRKAGFEVDPPRLQRLAEEGFSLRLAATWEEQGAVK